MRRWALLGGLFLVLPLLVLVAASFLPIEVPCGQRRLRVQMGWGGSATLRWSSGKYEPSLHYTMWYADCGWWVGGVVFYDPRKDPHGDE